jgi:transposase
LVGALLQGLDARQTLLCLLKCALRVVRHHQAKALPRSVGRITKAGDAYLRSLLVLGARALLAAAKNKTDSVSRWAVELEKRRGYWKAVVAIAAKNARMAWAVLRRGEDFVMPA